MGYIRRRRPVPRNVIPLELLANRIEEAFASFSRALANLCDDINDSNRANRETEIMGQLRQSFPNYIPPNRSTD